jgi:hypothetical protein
MEAPKFTRWNGDLIGLLVGLALAGAQKIWRDYQQHRSETWPISYGRINSVTVDSQEKRNKIKCYYTYRVEAETFTGSFQKTFQDPDEATAWAEALDNKQVAVHYDPANPSRSQLGEVDLEPMVRAAAASFRATGGEAELSGPDRLLVSAAFVLATLGLAVTVVMLIGEMAGRTLIPSAIASKVSIGGYLLFFAALWIRKGGTKQARATPTWMKYLGYALLYYAIFSATLGPSHRLLSDHGPDSRRHHEFLMDARYQLFLYFSAFEWCYARLRAREDDPLRQSQIA